MTLYSAGMARPRDTSADAYRSQMAAFRSMTPAERLRLADQMSSDVVALAAAGIRRRRPHATPDEVQAALAELLLGPELAVVARRVRLAATR